LDFGPLTFSFDIVPAVDLGDDIEIIDTKKGCWQISNTRELMRVVADRNIACKGRFIHQARFGKTFVRNTLDGLVPGLHVEAFAFPVITEPMDDDEATAALLASGARSLAPGATYTDPTGVDELGHRLDPPARTKAHAAFVEGARLAEIAVAYRKADNHNAAIAIWHKLFGDCFPKPDAGTALAVLGTGGGVGTAAVVSRAAAVAPTPTRSWRP
jgi:hypothetical protein